jgi:hypothetical protein
LFEEVADEVGGGDDALEVAFDIDDGEGVELASGEGFCGLANGVLDADDGGAGLHDGADAELVVEEGVNGALVLAEGLEAQLEEVGGADDADDAAAIDDGDVVKLPFSEELSDIGELLGQVNGDDIGGHNVRDGFISLH